MGADVSIRAHNEQTGVAPEDIGLEPRLHSRRESAQTKSKRILVEGRLIIRAIYVDRIVAHCRGTGAIHNLGYDRGHWRCSCPVTTDRCSHLLALQTVTVRPEWDRDEPPDDGDDHYPGGP